MWSGELPFALPGEQSQECARAINFTLLPLADDLSILGNPTFRLYLSTDAEMMPVAVRLLDVATDGTSVLVTKGILNATRRDGMDAPQPLRPGVVTPVAYHLEARPGTLANCSRQAGKPVPVCARRWLRRDGRV